MNKKNLFIPLVALLHYFIGYSQCEGIPDINESVPPLLSCMDNYNGMGHFNLVEKEWEIIKDYNKAHSITFYNAFGDEISNIYMGMPGETITAKVIDVETGCEGESTFWLDVVYINSYPPTPLEVCDNDYDGFESFDLESKTNEITQGDANMSVTYHLTEEDVWNNQNPLSSPYTNVVEGRQTIYARIVNMFNNNDPWSSGGEWLGCYNMELLDLVVDQCDWRGRIEINAFLDDNNNGIKDASERSFNKGIVTYEKNQDFNNVTLKSQTGTYVVFSEDANNVFDIVYSIPPAYASYYNVLSNAVHQDVMVAMEEKQTINIPVQLVTPYNDIALNLVSLFTPRPGFEYKNKVIIKNNGSSYSYNGTVNYALDAQSEYIGISEVSDGVTVTPTATGLQINYDMIASGSEKSLVVTLKIPPTVLLNDLITNEITTVVGKNEINFQDNTSVLTETVIGSYDPNDILESHGPEILYEDFSTQEYLFYTIRFQNIGTAEAINVRIEDEINSLLDSSTLEILSASHPMQLKQEGNQLTWQFDAINLPGESQNEPESHGYVHYKIKPASGYTVGTIIPNKADIYFDFNAPVITNTFTTEFIDRSLLVNSVNALEFVVFPNPVTDKLTIRSNQFTTASVQFVSLKGDVISDYTVVLKDNTVTLNVSQLPRGLYFIVLQSDSKRVTKKILLK